MKEENIKLQYEEELTKIYKNYFSGETTETIFLNGKWGSGKTTFLNKMFKKSDKKTTVRTIDLWHQADHTKTSEIVYKKLFCPSYIFVKYGYFIFSLLITAVSFWGSHYFKNSKDYFLIFSVGLILGLNTYIIKLNWNSLFFSLLKVKTSMVRKKIIVIIDDFDRLTSVQQDELYKIFNMMESKKIQFIFVGGYLSLHKSETTYLQKVINHRLELPYCLSPDKIWKTYKEKLIREVELARSTETSIFELDSLERKGVEAIFEIAILENRVIRELKQYMKLVEVHVFEEKRVDKVVIDQLLLLLYLYHFHIDVYMDLKNNMYSILSIESKKDIEKVLKIKEETVSISSMNDLNLKGINSLLKDQLEELVVRNEAKLSIFKQTPSIFLINNVPDFMGSREIETYLDRVSSDLLQELTINNIEEIGAYIIKNVGRLDCKHKENLITSCIALLKKNSIDYNILNGETSNNRALKNIVSIALKLDIDKYQSKEIWLDYVCKEGSKLEDLDFSQKVIILMYYGHIPSVELRDCLEDDLKNIFQENKIDHQSYPYIPYVLYINDINEIENRIVKEIVSLNDINFLSFLYYNSRFEDDIATITISSQTILHQFMDRLEKINQKELKLEITFIVKQQADE